MDLCALARALRILRARIAARAHVYATRCLISVADILDPLLQPDHPGTPRFRVYVTRLFRQVFMYIDGELSIGLVKYTLLTV